MVLPRRDIAEPVGMSRWFVTSGATPTSQILVGITIGVMKPVAAARHLAIVSSSETWNPLVAMPIQEAVSTTFDATPALALRTHMRWRLNAWAEMPTATLNGPVVVDAAIETTSLSTLMLVRRTK